MGESFGNFYRRMREIEYDGVKYNVSYHKRMVKTNTECAYIKPEGVKCRVKTPNNLTPQALEIISIEDIKSGEKMDLTSVLAKVLWMMLNMVLFSPACPTHVKAEHDEYVRTFQAGKTEPVEARAI